LATSCAVARIKDGTSWREWLDWESPRRAASLQSHLFIVIGAAVFGIPVTKSWSAGGFQDPSSESAEGAALLSDKFHPGDMAADHHTIGSVSANRAAARSGQRIWPRQA
jgi:RND superfamily putative drug exporter